MAHGLTEKDPLRSSDGSKVDVEAGQLLTKDLTNDELLRILILELREFKAMLLAL